MIQTIIEAGVRLRLLVIVVAVVIMVLGIRQLRNTPLEAFPDFGPVRVEVQTEALGLSPEEVENLITNPMEQEFFNGIPWLHEIRSDSLPGLSSIEMIFEPGTDPIRARQVVQERLTMVPALPQVSKAPFVIQPLATTSRFMMIGLSSEEVSLIDLSVLARWKIRQRLLSVPGVANVSIWGFRDRQLQVLVDPDRLNQNGIQLEDVIRTAGNAMWSSPLTFVEASTPGTGGFIDTAGQRIEIQHIQPIKTAQELAQVTIEGAEDRSLTLGQVAQVVENHQPLIGDAVVGDRPGVLLVVERFPGASIVEVTNRVEKALDAMRPGLSGIEIDTTLFRAASYVERGRANFIRVLGFGLLLLLIFLIVAFLRNLRFALISILAVILSLVSGWLVLGALGAKLNMMVVAGMMAALAIIIDDSIVYVENIGARLRQRRAEGGDVSVIETIMAGTREMGAPLLTAIAIVIVSMAPVFVLTEVNAAFLQPLARSYALAVIVSMLVALIFTPALAVALLSGEQSRVSESLLVDRLRRGYRRLLGAVVGRPLWMAALAVVIILISGILLPSLGSLSLFPELEGYDLLVHLEGEPGASLPEMASLTAAVSKDLRAIPGVRNVGGHIGRASTSDKLLNVDTAELWVNTDPAADYAAIVSAVEGVLGEGYPDLRPLVTTYPEQRFREVTAGSGDDLVVRVYGRFYDVLNEKAEEVVKSISDVAGVFDPQVSLPLLEPTVEIEVLIPQAAAKGIKPGDVRRSAATMVAGITAGNLFEEQKIFDVVVWGEPDKRDSLASIENMRIDTPSGNLVRLSDVADVAVRPNPSVIKHDAVSRYVDVIAQVQGRSLAAVTADVEARLAAISFPIEHHAEVLGEAKQRQNANRILLGYIIAALVAVFFLFHARFSSWRIATLLFVLLLLGLAGSVLAASLLPKTSSILSLMGGLAVITVAARGSILLISCYQRLEHEEGETFGPDLVLRGSEQRFGAILLGALATVLALVPLLVYGAVSGLELVAPLAVVVFAGLLTTALLNLFILPALYLRFCLGTQPEELGLGSGHTTSSQLIVKGESYET